MLRRTTSHQTWLAAVATALMLSVWSAKPACADFICDFEDPVDPLCADQGVVWTNEGGQPTLTSSVSHSPSRSLYNNFNAPISYSGPPIQSLWIGTWTGFPATRVTLEGAGIIVDFSNSTNWQKIDVGGASQIKFVPDYLSGGGWMYNFGTFAVDDLNVIPEPATLALLLVGGSALARRRK